MHFSLGKKSFVLRGEKNEVTALCASPDRIHLAVGYSDGTLIVYSLLTGDMDFQLALHRSAINVLCYDSQGLLLVSGGQDTDLVVVDTVEQVGKSRLAGHSGAITDVCFYERLDNIVISSSKDTRIKFWNIETKSCFQTLVDHRTDIWGISLLRNSQYLVSGSAENALNVYTLSVATELPIAAAISNQEESESSLINCKLSGNIVRGGKGRTVSLVADPTGSVLGCHGTDDTIDLFYFCTTEESLNRLAKRLKKHSPSVEADAKTLSLSDEVRRLTSIKAQGKIKSIDLLLGLADELRVAVSFANNYIKLFSTNVREKHAEPLLLKSLMQHGHHSEVRTVAFSSDGLAIASGSGDSLKLWNRDTLACLRTVNDVGYVLSATFVPGDRHVLLGLKCGSLLIVDVVVGQIIEKIEAHKSECWSVSLLPDQKGCVTGGGDATVKLWSFELIDDPSSENGIKVLSLLHKNTLKLTETVFCVRVSPNGKFIAVGLLDSTVQVFFMDTFKFYLSLYGHKLPVLCLDISDDSAIIVTGSADRNVKIWGMDFGDCHRSLFAHDDSVMGIQFIPDSHMFWTCGKDGKIKQWDGDSFLKIITMPGHIGEAFGLAVDRSGHMLATCGSDKVIRLFERTQETIVLQDVQEEEREELENRTLATGEESIVPGLPHLKLASRKTVGSEKAAESIMECLQVGQDFDESGDKELPPLMRAYNATSSDDYLMIMLEKIRPNDLEEALLILPFSTVCTLLDKIQTIADARKDRTELICKIVLFLMRIHQKPIVGNHSLLPILQTIINKLQSVVVELRDMIGTNHHALQLLQRDIESKDGVELFRDASKAKKKLDKKNKKRQQAKRLHVQMN